MKVFQSLSATAQDIAIPYAFCELCTDTPENTSVVGTSSDNSGLFEGGGGGDQQKQRAVCECLNCNIPMCAKCRTKHAGNPRLASHKIVNYQQMMFNANKFGNSKKDDSVNNSVSPTRRGTAAGLVSEKNPGKSPKVDGMSIMSANSSGKFSVRNVLGGGGGINESARGEPLELMTCPSHEGMPLDHYSINIREFMCKTCIREIEGTQREIDLNPIGVEDAFKVLENRLNMQ